MWCRDVTIDIFLTIGTLFGPAKEAIFADTFIVYPRRSICEPLSYRT
jgi:hypothetical protein